ncbi:FKBP-type peptidyl-prolyl cis-trans isomerase [Xanthomonas sp. AmX2]|uniref:FKBP-type peptidyl-prolyl cis-trans isomerase n=1 Tax=Xanthomonas sp. TaxID=29446 RepID=UPI001981AD53|nr:FKBP-type peptidyl-prolyl cis-trans isomerase [Xanthomonas sp.]MBN6152633.1 FKBP-type peptidyl-prolyl cis-trans isomerase [Xanthomonas sp.]
MRRALLLLCLSLPAWLSGCTPPGPPPGGTIAAFEKIDRRVGSGAEATPGSLVTVHYTGWLYDEKAKDRRGEKFDASADHGQPFSFPLGGGQVIRGWDEGVAGMRVGGTRTLMIPPDYGYGDRGAGGAIPPRASLVFEVELLDVKPR